jgi:pimeloyl-ACP methyl ester carboxylesterase
MAVTEPKDMVSAAMRRLRTINPVRPAELSRRDGLAYALWQPDRAPLRGGVLILHGAGSCKESHYDFCRALLPLGFASISFDQRGHGESDGPMDGRAISDVNSMSELLSERTGKPMALRGSSMGGYLALVAASQVGAGAVVAICPASADQLRRSLRSGSHRFNADLQPLDALLGQNDDLHAIVEALEIPVLLLHAEGDEVVPVEHSRELAGHLRHPESRLVVVPGGHHRSVQHDEELQALSTRFIERALGS